MNPKEMAEFFPWLVSERFEGASSPIPVAGGEVHEQTPNWTYSTGSTLTLATILADSNELRLTTGVATGIPDSTRLSGYVNALNRQQLLVGRAFTVETADSGLVALLMQVIIFGDSLSSEFMPSLQNVLRITTSIATQAERAAIDVVPRFECRPFEKDGLVYLMVNV